jgi:hypothetical protein
MLPPNATYEGLMRCAAFDCGSRDARMRAHGEVHIFPPLAFVCKPRNVVARHPVKYRVPSGETVNVDQTLTTAS